MKFRQPYDENYNPADYATPVGYELDSNIDKQMQNALEASATEQSFAPECDVNNIIKQYQQTGLLPERNGAPLTYGDISDSPTFQEALNVVASANEAFASLPAALRDRFYNDPSRFLAFMDDENNFDEAVKLGLVNKPSPKPEPLVEAAAQATETPPAA